MRNTVGTPRDSVTDIILRNRATLRLFKADTEEQFIDSIDKVFEADAIDVFIDELCAIWEKKEIFNAESDHRTLDGDHLTVLISMPIPKTGAEARSVSVTILDITERKKRCEKAKNGFVDYWRIRYRES